MSELIGLGGAFLAGYAYLPRSSARYRGLTCPTHAHDATADTFELVARPVER